MKKICISFSLILIIVLSAIFLQGTNQTTEYLRIHIRANSNSQEDQSVKYEVKDIVTNYLTPIIENAQSKTEAITTIETNKSAINGLIDQHLKEKGFNYRSNIKICQEEFPTRIYDNVTLEAGIYDAIIIELGTATGDNWWCVVYPPLCFSQGDITYRSVIADFFKRLKEGG